MNSSNNSTKSAEVSRRGFLKTSSLAASVAALGFPSLVQAQSNQAFKAVIIGCGGRGAGAGQDFLEAAKAVGVDAKIVGVADIFESSAKRSAKQFGVADENCFSGFDAFEKVLGVDGVNYAILASPPGFRPIHFKAAVAAGKNVFMEKPVAVDGPGCRVMYAAYEEAKKKNLKVAAGTQRRHQASYIETIKRLQDGAIGDIIALRAYWVNGGPIWHRGLRGDTDLEKQVYNWYHYIWLSGDHICEQHVHNIDVCNWIMNDHPVRCWGQGSRQQLADQPGEIWDNFDIEFEYPNGTRMFAYCGQIRRGWSSVSEAVHGANGTSNASDRIQPKGFRPWRFTGKGINPYVQEHIDLINAILKDADLNEAKQVTDSTLTAIMGREAAYSGSGVTWESIMNSQFAYGPKELYTNPAGMKWGPFRTLKPPMPSQFDILADVPKAPTVG